MVLDTLDSFPKPKEIRISNYYIRTYKAMNCAWPIPDDISIPILDN